MIDQEQHKFVAEDNLIQHMDMMLEHKMMIMIRVKANIFNDFFLLLVLDDLDPSNMNDVVELDSKMGTKKRLKLEAKAEKREQREVKLWS
jgi:hypothetical protein